MKKRIRNISPIVRPLELSRVKTLTVGEESERITGRRLQERNERFLRQHPLCVACARRDMVTAAVQVDHRIPLHAGGHDTLDNLQGLCLECHAVKNAQEARDRAAGTTLHHAAPRATKEPGFA